MPPHDASQQLVRAGGGNVCVSCEWGSREGLTCSSALAGLPDAGLLAWVEQGILHLLQWSDMQSLLLASLLQLQGWRRVLQQRLSAMLGWANGACNVAAAYFVLDLARWCVPSCRGIARCNLTLCRTRARCVTAFVMLQLP